MNNQFLLFHRGEPVYLRQCAAACAYSPADFSAASPVAGTSLQLTVISFDFASALQRGETSSVPGFHLVPVEKTDPFAVSWHRYREFEPLLSREEFSRQVKKIQQRMTEGDYYLFNYTFAARLHRSAGLAREVTDFGEAGGYLPFSDFTLLSFSPETFLEIRDDFITTYPIKGTAPADSDEADLLRDAKEHAEHTMVTDLLRNDLGILCRPGTVSVPRFKALKKHHGLWQMFSEIRGQLREPFEPLRHLPALLPAGSISGTPKSSVLVDREILEHGPRGYYTGIAGLHDPLSGEGFWNILIRTVESRGGEDRLGVGAGITVDSDPEREYEECLQKLSSVYARLRD